jgi:hypothetical protein
VGGWNVLIEKLAGRATDLAVQIETGSTNDVWGRQ